jgi:hypothetical protein
MEGTLQRQKVDRLPLQPIRHLSKAPRLPLFLIFGAVRSGQPLSCAHALSVWVGHPTLQHTLGHGHARKNDQDNVEITEENRASLNINEVLK